MRYFGAVFIFLIFHSAFAQGNLRQVLAPDEIPAGEQFTVIVAGTPISKDQNRMVAIEFPESWKFVKAYAAENGATESSPILQNSDMASYFPKEKGLTVKIFEDDTHIFAENYESIAYFFTFTAPSITTAGSFKACYIERSDPGVSEPKETKRGKKPKPVRIRNFEWRITSPSLGDNFSFAEITGKRYTHQIRFITGWSNTSGALVLHSSSKADAQLQVRPDLLQNFFNNPFTIGWWMHATSGEQTLFKFLRSDTSSGLLIDANPFGQIEVHRYPGDADSDIAILSSSTACDGAWHQITLSVDVAGTLRLFTDGQLDDTTINAAAFFQDLSSCSIGVKKAPEYFSMDELFFTRRAIISPNEILPEISIASRDTVTNAFAIFHFEDFGKTAHSSVALVTTQKESGQRPIAEQVYLTLDSGASMLETSSPVLLEHAPLVVDQSSPTKITFAWRATSELGIKRYVLQRRIATFGDYEKTLSVEAKRSIPSDETDKPIIARASYSAAEKLPQLSHDIDLYYRLALIGYNDSVLYYTEPVKLEFGGERDVFVEQNKPNPFNPKTSITFRLAKKTAVSVSVYDIIGRQVAVLLSGKLAAGKHLVEIDATNWPGGIYFYKVKTLKTSVTKKMVLAK